MITCAYCGTTNPDATLFCSGCGEMLHRGTHARAVTRSWDIFALVAVVLVGTVLIGFLAYLDRG